MFVVINAFVHCLDAFMHCAMKKDDISIYSTVKTTWNKCAGNVAQR